MLNLSLSMDLSLEMIRFHREELWFPVERVVVQITVLKVCLPHLDFDWERPWGDSFQYTDFYLAPLPFEDNTSPCLQLYLMPRSWELASSVSLQINFLDLQGKRGAVAWHMGVGGDLMFTVVITFLTKPPNFQRFSPQAGLSGVHDATNFSAFYRSCFGTESRLTF